MSFRFPLRSRKSRRPPPCVQPSGRCRDIRPWFEALEDRRLLSGTVTLAPNDNSVLVGERVTWTATAADVGASPVYQFSAAPHGGAFHVVRDFSPASAFAWTPMQEGTYDIEVAVKNGYQGTEATSAVAEDDVASRLVGSQAVVTPTPNPLVALYSVPPSSAATAFVQFSPAGDHPSWRNTDARAVTPGKSTNFFVAGMLPNTTYQMRHVFSDGTGSAPILFTTGTIPAGLVIPPFTVVEPPGAGSDTDQDMIFHQRIRGTPSTPPLLATDLAGQVTWYYDSTTSGFTLTKAGQSLAPGGTLLLNGADRYTPVPAAPNVLREIDLAGNPVRETNLAAVNAELARLGYTDRVHAFHHDVQRLADGTTVALAYLERSVTTNGTPTNYVGEMVLVLDQDFQVKWAWDAFDHLDVHRGPVLGEVISPGSPEPTAAVPVLPAVDWLHVNAVALAPDGNLILSVRHQDWVIKIDYEKGAGDGHVVWRLGAGGDFALNGAAPDAWFSHQHNAHYVDDHTLVLFDNGNTRQASAPTAHSRGQVWTLDEKTMTATPVVNTDLGNYSFRLGSAQRLSNGNYSFMSGSQGTPPNEFAQSIEVLPDGTRSYALEFASPEYRSYRLRTLYEGTDDAVAGPPGSVQSVVINDGCSQRSQVSNITINFSGVAILDPGAIDLRRRNGAPVDFQIVISVVGGKTVAVLTLAGGEFGGSALHGGNYTLTVLADRVHDRWGRALDGNGDGSAGGNYTLMVRADRMHARRGRALEGTASEGIDLDFDRDGDAECSDHGEVNRRLVRS